MTANGTERRLGLCALTLIAATRVMPVATGANLPIDHPQRETPETRTLSREEAALVLERDWNYQALPEPLLTRTEKEIAWARALAERLSRRQPAPDLSTELNELLSLEEQRGDLRAEPVKTPGRQEPAWIWHPEGSPAEDARVESRYFRRSFDVPAAVRHGELRVAADDACEVFVNGVRLGAHATWQRAAVFPLGDLLRPGTNTLSIRAENRAAPVEKNPAGLIVFLTVALTNETQVVVVSDRSWRTAKAEQPGWRTVGFDDAAWEPAMVAGSFGSGPWGKIDGLTQPASSYAHEDPALRALYLSVRRVKRRVFFKNPVLDFSKLLFIDQPMPQGPEVIHEAIHRMGIMAESGGRLLVLDGLHPGGKVRQLAPDKPGSFWRPDLSFDAGRVLFCYKAHEEPSFHLYEMDADGTGLNQLTHGPYDDIDPIYLPDGHIMFTSTRGNSYVRCGPFIYSYVLARCDADGGNVYLVSNNNEPDFLPALMSDGRVIYSRWEYTDKALWRVQSLWTVNPDGTQVNVFWGNQSVWPDHVAQPRQIPGSPRVMFCGVGHHDWWSGTVGIIDPRKGLNFPDGLTKVTRDRPWPECGNGPVDPGESETYHASGAFTGYSSPYPLSEEDFLVSARGTDNRFRLYLMDVDGNRELIYEGVHNILHAIPIKPRPRPPVQPDAVAWPGTGAERKPLKPGVLFTADVYDGVPDLPRGMARYLRVVQQDYKTYSTWEKTYRHSGPAVSIVQEEAVKRIVGTVPIEKDGSVSFKVPPGQALFFQLLDKDYRCLQTMRSFTGVMPGEERGCTGCHEMHSTILPSKAGGIAIALQQPPRDLTPPPWNMDSIGYERFVQPALDRYCVSCHGGDGKGQAPPDLRLRAGHGPFKEPYLTLVGAAGWGNPIKPGPGYGCAGAIPVEQMGANNPASLRTIRPMQYLSYTSKLVELSSSGKHYDVKMDAASLRRLIAWVDASCPYRGDEEIRALNDPDFPGIEKLPIRPRVKTAPVVARP